MLTSFPHSGHLAQFLTLLYGVLSCRLQWKNPRRQFCIFSVLKPDKPEERFKREILKNRDIYEYQVI